MKKKWIWKECQQDERFIPFSEGNIKLAPTSDVKYLIFNIPAMITCPFSTPHCRKCCYAKKSECGARPKVLPARKRNLEYTKKDDFVKRMVWTINQYIERPSYKTAKAIVIRIHESGDFYNREYMKKWYQIARAFDGNDKVVFMCYTKSIRFMKGLKKPENLVIRFSLWDDTKEEERQLAERMGLPVYTAVEKFDDDIRGRNRCLCDNCSTCGKCWSGVNWLACEIH